MKEFKGTPGPWFVDESGDVSCLSRSDIVAGVAGYDQTDEDLANANLIAQAPYLLGLLIELIDIEGPQPGDCKWASKVKSAIARALGEKQ